MYLVTESTTNLFNNNIFTRVKDTMKAVGMVFCKSQMKQDTIQTYIV